MKTWFFVLNQPHGIEMPQNDKVQFIKKELVQCA